MRASTRKKIESALEVVDYRPNLTARNLRAGRSHRIGVLTHDLHQVGVARIINAATAAARRAGFVLDVIGLDMSDGEDVSSALDELLNHEVAGIIALASTDETRHAFKEARIDVPFVLASEAEDDARSAVTEMVAVAIPHLVAYLRQLGHRNFLHIAGPQNWTAGRNRLRAYEAAVSAVSGVNAGVLIGDWSARSAYRQLDGLAEVPRATAFVCANDQMAMGAIRFLADKGMSVPRDVSVTGVDDVPEAEFFLPALTTVRLNFDAQGVDLVNRLLATLNEATMTAPPPPEPHRAELVIRESTGNSPLRSDF